MKNDTVKRAMELESMAAINSMGVSSSLFISMDQNTTNLFGPEKNGPGGKYRLYKIGMEKS
jgi:hypothetical protein